MTHTISPQDITGLILAGGRGSRMGGVDKGLQNFNGIPLALHTLMRLGPQVETLLRVCLVDVPMFLILILQM